MSVRKPGRSRRSPATSTNAPSAPGSWAPGPPDLDADAAPRPDALSLDEHRADQRYGEQQRERGPEPIHWPTAIRSRARRSARSRAARTTTTNMSPAYAGAQPWGAAASLPAQAREGTKCEGCSDWRRSSRRWSCSPPASRLRRRPSPTAVGGLTLPWDVQWTPGPNPVMVFTERPGTLEAIVAGQRADIAQPSDLLSQYESGMMGLAIDPAFATNRRVYTCMHSSLAGGVGDIRVVRWTVNADLHRHHRPHRHRHRHPREHRRRAGQHSGCRPRFGPDGALWIGTGDAWTGRPAEQALARRQGAARDTDGAGARRTRGRRERRPPASTPGSTATATATCRGIAFRPSDGKAFSRRAGHDLRRRGEPAAARRQLRLGPARRRRRALRRDAPDDRPHEVPDGDPGGVDLGLPDDRHVGRRFRDRRGSGASGTGCSSSDASRARSCSA